MQTLTNDDTPTCTPWLPQVTAPVVVSVHHALVCLTTTPTPRRGRKSCSSLQPPMTTGHFICADTQFTNNVTILFSTSVSPPTLQQQQHAGACCGNNNPASPTDHAACPDTTDQLLAWFAATSASSCTTRSNTSLKGGLQHRAAQHSAARQQRSTLVVSTDSRSA